MENKKSTFPTISFLIMADTKVVALTPAERKKKLEGIATAVRGIFAQVVDNISSMIKDLREDKLTKVSTISVDMAVNFVKTYDPIKLMEKLLDKHNHFERVLVRDEKFFSEDIMVLFSELPDVDILKLPLTIYQKHRNEGFKNFEGGEEAFPIGGKDILGLWSWFTTIIQGACSYNKNLEKPDPAIMAYNDRVTELVNKDKEERARKEKLMEEKRKQRKEEAAKSKKK